MRVEQSQILTISPNIKSEIRIKTKITLPKCILDSKSE